MINKLSTAAIFVTILLGLLSVKVKAQLIPDTTLNNDNSQVVNNGFNRDLIEGGLRKDSNLFHSFQEFNVGNDRAVYFANPTGVSNILTRVTGANQSQIFGTLGVVGNANLYLINPNGILFGSEARIDLNGSFIGSTAAAIELGNSGSFSAIAPASSNLLNVNPSALFFNSLAQQSQIIIQGDLAVQSQQTIGLLGGDILVDGGKISAPNGQIFLAAVNSGKVNLDLNNKLINNLEVNSFGNILITNRAKISANTSGNLNGFGIAIAANTVEISGTGTDIQALVESLATGKGGKIEIDAAILRVFNAGDIQAETFGPGNAGSININANTVEISGVNTDIEADVNSNATGNGGTINIHTNNLNVTDRAEIRAETFGPGQGGNINIIATNSIQISKNADIEVDVNSTATGNGGTINIHTNNLNVTDGAEIRAETFGSGNGGNINIIATNLVEVSENGDIEVDVNSNATGNGGTINIHTNDLKILKGGQIRAQTLSEGNGGNINITATNLVELRDNRSDITANVARRNDLGITRGNGGTININTNTLRILEGAEIRAETAAIAKQGEGNAGNINITATNLVEVSGVARAANGDIIAESQIDADVGRNATGRGGNITINTANLKILDRAEIRAETSGVGNTGNIIIAAQNIEVGRSGDIEIDVGSSAQGNGGKIDINTNTLKLFENGDIRAETSGAGDGGDIIINANSLEIANFESEITTNVNQNAIGNGGNITIDTNRLSLKDQGTISANTFGLGKAGNISIESNFLNLDRGVITSRTEQNQNSGNITLNTGTLLTFRNRSIIRTDAGTPGSGGNGGNIKINSPFIVAFPENNSIIANAFEGRGGNIDLSTRAIFGYPQFLTINASSELGIDGTINIETANINPSSLLRQLESTPIDVAAIVAKDLCRLDRGKIARGSSLIVTGKGGLPPTPSTPINYDENFLDWVDIPTSDLNLESQTIKPVVVKNDSEVAVKKVSFIEAKGWVKRADGKIVLTANPISRSSKNSLVHPSCLQ
ncbi:MAG: filamentous hemagglutinin N-terminal domain-containing protein [Prochloraceae cyanobacterium]|nr:filamentous hemagglutinin N-terminal domain-containing protein [Prochloraceae cyanobacterium]